MSQIETKAWTDKERNGTYKITFVPSEKKALITASSYIDADELRQLAVDCVDAARAIEAGAAPDLDESAVEAATA